MRANQLVHERHLLEAVRRGVIDQGQAEAVLAIARSEPGGAARLPDLGWIGLAQGAALAVAAVGVCVANVDHPWRVSPSDELTRGVIATAAFLAVGLGLRRFRWAEVPAAVCLGGAALQLVAVGHALGRDSFDGGDRGMTAGFALALVAGAALWRWLRAGPALGVACFAAVGVLIGALRARGGFSGHEVDVTSFTAAGALLLTWSSARDLHPRARGVDGEFWTHSAGALFVAIAAAEVIDRTPGAIALFAPLALFVGWLGLALRRRILLGAAGFALLTAPAFAAAEAHAGDAAVGATLVVSALGVGALSHFVRREMLARAADAPADDRSVWM